MAFAGRRVSLRVQPKVYGVTIGQASDDEMLVHWDNDVRTIEYGEDLIWHAVQDGAEGSRVDPKDRTSTATQDQAQRRL